MVAKTNNVKKRFSTDRQAAALRPLPGQKQTEYYHSSEDGLILRAGIARSTWAVKYLLDNERRKITLKPDYPELSLQAATKECRRIRAEAMKGKDPLGHKKKRHSAPTIKDVMDLYFKETNLTAKGKAESKRISEKDIIPLLGKRKAMDLKRIDVKGLHSAIVERGAPVTANRTVALLGGAFNCAHEEELIDINPFPNLKKIKAAETSRERILTDSEIKDLWIAMEQESSNMRDILRLLLILGQRSNDIMSMRVSDIDSDRKEWTVPAPPRGKNKKPNVLPFPPLVWTIIEPRLQNSKWIFPSAYNLTRTNSRLDGHTKSTKDARRRLKAATGIEGWTGHDFRRTCRTIMSKEGVEPHIAERVLGHTQGVVEGIYDRHAYIAEKGDALIKIDRAVCKIVGLRQEKAKIIKLKAAGA
jgi:integrase